MSDERIQELEMQLSYHEQTLEALNEVIARQDRAISTMQKQIKYLDTQVKKFGSDDSNMAVDANEPPPHY